MFDEYAEKLKNLGENVPAIFRNVAKRGANHFVKEAVELTDKEGLVDTGAYKRNWAADAAEISKGKYSIICINSMEYASFLEEGHALRGNKPYAFKRPYKIKRPQNMVRGRYKGFFVGKRAMIDTEGWAIIELQEELDAAIMAKKYNISKSQAKKYLK